jgi:hypothetical protein
MHCASGATGYFTVRIARARTSVCLCREWVFEHRKRHEFLRGVVFASN